MYRVLNRCLAKLMITGLVLQLTACGMAPHAVSPTTIGETVPRTDKAFLNDPDNFQFVIVGDRTGGHRPGIFKRAMTQINWLQPEFVMCVGDLIEGYTEDKARVLAQWDEMDGMLNSLDMPFFYTVGNHDITNPMMAEIWQQRLGQTYYHFVYKNVLFLSLNTEDPPVALSKHHIDKAVALENMMEKDPEGTQKRILSRRKDGPPPTLPGSIHISDKQVAYVEQVLAENPDVRWTLVFMHKPAWKSNDAQFERIEKMLQDRDYSVIGGHEHYYSYTRRHDRDYIDMGTTGGVWLSTGPGSEDHISWVTMTEEGPVFANIKLDGLSDKEGLP